MNKVIVTSVGELQLMFTRLVIDVFDHPDWYQPSGEGIERFYFGENKRRDLEDRNVEDFIASLSLKK